MREPHVECEPGQDPPARGLHSTAGGTKTAVRRQTGLRRSDETLEGDLEFRGDAEAGEESLRGEQVAHGGCHGEVTQEKDRDVTFRFSDRGGLGRAVSGPSRKPNWNSRERMQGKRALWGEPSAVPAWL